MDQKPRPDEEKRPLPGFVGMFASNKGEERIAERADEILREDLPAYLLAEQDD